MIYHFRIFKPLSWQSCFLFYILACLQLTQLRLSLSMDEQQPLRFEIPLFNEPSTIQIIRVPPYATGEAIHAGSNSDSNDQVDDHHESWCSSRTCRVLRMCAATGLTALIALALVLILFALWTLKAAIQVASKIPT